MAVGSFPTISIVRRIPIVNGFLQTPPNFEYRKTSVPIEDVFNISPPIPLAIRRLGPTGGASTAGPKGTQEFFEAGAYSVDGIAEDYNGLIGIFETE